MPDLEAPLTRIGTNPAIQTTYRFGKTLPLGNCWVS